MKNIKYLTAIVVAVVIGAGIFYACQKEEVSIQDNSSPIKEDLSHGQAIQKKIIELDYHFTATNGDKFHITGWADINFIPPRLNSWDIRLKNETTREEWHFKGESSTPPNGIGGQKIISGHLYDKAGNTTSFAKLPELSKWLTEIVNDNK